MVAFVMLLAGWTVVAKAAANYLPLEIGNRWNYSLVAGTAKMTAEFKVSEKTVVDGVDVMVFDGYINGMNQQKEYYQIKPEGVFTIRRKMGVYNFRFTPQQIFLKYPVTIGDSWEQEFLTSDEEKKISLNSKMKCTYFAFEKLSVPAGVFNVVKLQIDLETSDGSKVEGFRYFADGIGIIKEDMTISAKGKSVSVVSVLTDYQVNKPALESINQTKETKDQPVTKPVAVATQTSNFPTLDAEVQKNPWGTKDKAKAAIFEGIFLSEKSKSDFPKGIMDYVDGNLDRYYWIGTFLFDTDYARITDYDLAQDVLLSGLASCETEKDQVRFYFAAGLLNWRKGDKMASRSFFAKGIQLAKKYPDAVPAMNPKERDEIYKAFGF